LGGLREAARGLVDSLVAHDLMKHLVRQGLLLPPELQAAPGPVPSAQAQGGRGGLFGRRPAPAAPQAVSLRRPADDLADLLAWEEGALAVLLDLAEPSVAQADRPALAAIRARFGAREERLQARIAEARGRLLENRTRVWQPFEE